MAPGFLCDSEDNSGSRVVKAQSSVDETKNIEGTHGIGNSGYIIARHSGRRRYERLMRKEGHNIPIPCRVNHVSKFGHGN